MNIKSIDSLVYLIKKAHEAGSLKPIVFIGAGMSVTAGIPVANKILKDILIKYKDKPEIQNLSEEEKNYVTVMSKLNASERNETLRTYIDEAKINAAHIYLAQLLHEGYIDYVLTVNFDNVLLRASALFNYIPPVYDIANIESLTTTTIQKRSVTYLHGQHTGLYLLNTDSEMGKIQKRISPFLNKICNGRTWIIIGYSGDDAIFNQIINLGRFDSELFWIGYKDQLPNKKVQESFLDDKNSGASLINGYDADNFFMTLHRKLGCEIPKIFTNPFSFLNQIISNVATSNEETESINQSNKLQETTASTLVKELLSNVKFKLNDAIKRYEISEISNTTDIVQEIDIAKLKQKLLEITIKEDFEKEITFIETVRHNPELNKELSILYLDWGTHLINQGEQHNDLNLFKEGIKKYQIAEEFYAVEKNIIYNNYGVALTKMYRLTNDELYYHESIKKFSESCILDPNYSSPLYNWANIIAYKALSHMNKELFYEAISKFKEAFEVGDNKDLILCNWGNCLSNLYKIEQKEPLLLESLEKYEASFKINPLNESAIVNWANNTLILAKKQKTKNLFESAFEKYETALKINPSNYNTYSNFAGGIIEYNKITHDKTHLNYALSMALIASKSNKLFYNLSCIYALLENYNEALNNLEKSLKIGEIDVSHVLRDEEWINLQTNSRFLNLIKEFTTT